MRKFVLIAFLFLSAGLLVDSCKPPDMKSANEKFRKKEYSVAAQDYMKVYSSSKDRNERKEAAFKAAESFRLANNTKKAETWYTKAAKQKNADPEASYQAAVMMKGNEKWADAIVMFNEYKKLNPNDKRTDCEIKGCENALKWKDQKTRYVIENVKKLNSPTSDYAPMYYKKEGLYFSSDRPEGKSKDEYKWTGNGYSDIYFAKIDKSGKISTPAIVENVNTKYNDGVVTFDAKGNVMYFTQCGGESGKEKNCKIYKVDKKGNEWEPVNIKEPLSFCNDTVYVYGHPSLSADGSKLYFAANMKDGVGGMDLWVCNFVKRGKTWSDPINLGPAINTEGDEMYPFIHPDGTLYFSSNGHCGVGGLDIYMTKGEGNSWSEPVNMKIPVNSAGDDFAFICDNTKEKGYFTSNRIGSRQDDIYSFTMIPLVFNLTVRTFDAKTKEILTGTTVSLSNSYDTTVLKAITDASGAVKFKLAPNTDYETFGRKEDYYDSRTEAASTKGEEFSKDYVIDLYLEPFSYDFVKVEGILYDLDKANIRSDAAMILDSLVNILKKYPKLAIELGSHTDCRATMAYNCDLSQRRADSAIAYIIRNGIDAERLVARGYGEFRLTNDCGCEPTNASNCSEAQHQANRRTTVRILSTKWVKGTKLKIEADTTSPCASYLVNRPEPPKEENKGPEPKPQPKPTPGELPKEVILNSNKK